MATASVPIMVAPPVRFSTSTDCPQVSINFCAMVRAMMSVLPPAESGTISAFTAAHDDPATDAALVSYVSTFVPKMSGDNFNPHVSTGVAPKEYLDKMLAEPFGKFTFSPAGAAVYQLGPFGTAAKKLKEWDLKR